MIKDMKKETIEKAAREYAEDMISRQDDSNPLPPELRGYLMQLIQNCFKNGAIVALNSLVEMTIDNAILELAEYASECIEEREEGGR